MNQKLECKREFEFRPTAVGFGLRVWAEPILQNMALSFLRSATFHRLVHCFLDTETVSK
jgi:hypothetical protein